MPKAYICPECKGVLRPHKGPWSNYHCLPCQISVDMYSDPEPEQIEVDSPPEEYNPHEHAVVLMLSPKSGPK